MSIFLTIRQKFSSPAITPTLNIPISINNPPDFIQNGGPESLRMARNTCTNSTLTIVPPILVETTPASKTTLQKATNITNYSELDIQTVTNQEAKQVLFGTFFPPPVPPPQFLQFPPLRSNNEPWARQPPCIGPHRWELHR